jgi:hypothetical protein
MVSAMFIDDLAVGRERRSLMRRAIIAAGSFMLLILAFSQLARATLLENVPLDSWVYDVVDELHCQGFFPSLHTQVKPYTRGEIASAVLEINGGRNGGGRRLTDSQLWLLHKLNQEFRYELEQLLSEKDEKTGQIDAFRYGTSPVGHFAWLESDSSYGRVQFEFEAGIQFGDKLVLKDRVVVDTKAEKERTYTGREWKNSLTGVFDQAYAKLDLKYLRLFLGRDHLSWGPGREDKLLLSGQIPPFDMVKADASFGGFKLTCFSTVLDRIWDPESGAPAKRYLSGHRLNLKLKFGVEMGISEVVLYGGEDRDLELYYLNPLLPYYGEQHNNRNDDNILWSFDLTLSTFRNKEIYFELLVDDFQYDFESEPHQTGFKLGLNWADALGWRRSYVNLEYTKINNWVYGQVKPWNLYTYHGWGMGSELGPDADRISLRLLYHLIPEVDLNFSGQCRRKGEGRIVVFPESAVPDSDKFPSGVVERTSQYRLGFTYQPSVNLKLDLFAGYDRIRNPENQSGKKQQAFVFRTKLSLNLWKEKRL